MTSINFALIGLDHWYSAVPLAHGLSAHPETTLQLIVDRDPRRGRVLADELGVRFTTSVAEALADPGIEAIGSFPSVDENPQVCIDAAEAGKHVVSVKPVARTLQEASAVVRAVEEAGVQFIPAESRSRMTAQNQRLLELVRSGALGEIVSADFALCGVLPKAWHDSDSPGWWVEEARAPGGAWIDHSIYQIDRLRWLLGQEPVDVVGVTANLRYPELAVEDYGHAIFTFDGGVVATMEDTWTGAEGAWRITTTLNGTSGSLAIDTINSRTTVLRASGGAPSGWVELDPLPDDSDLIQPLVDRIRGKHNALGTVRDAWRNLAAARAFYDAAASGARRRVPVPEDETDETHDLVKGVHR
ncbi:gfo/Idh/MocA family oxidoreductase [Arachnia propionica]|uniref:Gfo/Idh/MocA family oxidoreductase n=1 Tax=Arachnia propionica TaxID=1750 RepID=A0A3P1T7L2_9ACTN|nr:Gfo/Idh/MocA family oxidoreductase [Arachnia propionica]RRD05175.1 gfo/Idh/MocA family oxidoreductase [Arachnia propionica]